ncbi:MAG: hypothetical protein NT007_18965 [Candidatus Kapabacteria bacterium]|nr:hypothetical protein [Candidatus Kapabacteria bacterium]
MNRRGFFNKMINGMPDVFFMGIQVAFPSQVRENIWQEFDILISNNRGIQSAGRKRGFYNEIVKKLTEISIGFELGYWDFIKNERDADNEFDNWVAELEEATANEIEGTDSLILEPLIIDDGELDYIVVTVAFLIKGNDKHEQIFRQINSITEDQFDDLTSYLTLITQIRNIDFESCIADAAFLIPGNINEVLSTQEIYGEGWEYLVEITKKL